MHKLTVFRSLIKAASPPAVNSRARIILSVDTRRSILLVREQVLEGAGYDVMSAIDGSNALHILSALPIDLAILSYRLPEMDGGVVASEIKRLKPGVPVILVSSGPVPESALSCVDSWVDEDEVSQSFLRTVEQLIRRALSGDLARERRA